MVIPIQSSKIPDSASSVETLAGNMYYTFSYVLPCQFYHSRFIARIKIGKLFFLFFFPPRDIESNRSFPPEAKCACRHGAIIADHIR